MSFHKVCTVAELVDDQPLAARINFVDILVIQTQCDGTKQIFALEDSCSHGAVKLSEGDIVGCAVECWLHGSTFDLRTGKPNCLPATEPVNTYPTKIEGDEVFVDVDNPNA